MEKNPWFIPGAKPLPLQKILEKYRIQTQEDYGAYVDVILPEKILSGKEYFYLKRRQFELNSEVYYEMAYTNKKNDVPAFQYNGSLYVLKTSGRDKDLVIAKMKQIVSYYKEYLKNKGNKVFD